MHPRAGIYVVRRQRSDLVKIGYTRNLTRRLQQLATANPEPLEVVRFISADERAERYLHRLFRHARIRGEWYPASVVTQLADVALPHKALRQLSLPFGG